MGDAFTQPAVPMMQTLSNLYLAIWVLCAIAVPYGLVLARRQGLVTRQVVGRALLGAALILALAVPHYWKELEEAGLPGWMMMPGLALAVPLLACSLVACQPLQPGKPAFPLLLGGGRRFGGWGIAIALGALSVLQGLALYLAIEGIPSSPPSDGGASGSVVTDMVVRQARGAQAAFIEELTSRGLALGVLLRLGRGHRWW